MSFCVDGSQPFSLLILAFTAPMVSLGSASIWNFCCFRSLNVSFMVGSSNTLETDFVFVKGPEVTELQAVSGAVASGIQIHTRGPPAPESRAGRGLTGLSRSGL
ncbi:hypothetical protein KC356_g317 [Hortaea werneckii]|nr:hypothetical protein KC356_g317 [Hortaea werneckii]